MTEDERAIRNVLVVAFALVASNIAAGQASNDQRPPEPRRSFDGPSLKFDFPGMFIGTAEYDEGHWIHHQSRELADTRAATGDPLRAGQGQLYGRIPSV